MEDKKLLKDNELENVAGGAVSENIEYEGVVVDKKPSGIFQVELENHRTIEAHLSGKLRLNNIRVIVGDTVTVEVSPYDVGCCRIIARLR